MLSFDLRAPVRSGKLYTATTAWLLGEGKFNSWCAELGTILGPSGTD